MSHLTLIRPPSLVTKGQISLNLIPPIGLAYLAASMIQGGHRVDIIDSVGENPMQSTPLNSGKCLVGLTHGEIVDRIDQNTDVIGLSIMFSHEWPEVKKLIQKIRQGHPSIPIVCGGEHTTALPEYILSTCPEVSFCVLGEGEETFLELIQSLSDNSPLEKICGIAYRRGKEICQSAPRDRLKEIDLIPPPAWELFPIKNYLDHHFCFGVDHGLSLPIMATRGCPYQCTFCSNPVMWKQKWITRDPRLVLQEMIDNSAKYGIENFEFCDLTAIVKKEWTVQFTKLLLRSGLKIAWQFPGGTRSEALDEEVCELLYKSGCKNLVYAPESGSKTVLQTVKKRVHLDRMKQSIRGALKMGISVRVNLVLGFPEDRHRDILLTFKFLFELAIMGIHDITHFIFVPYPGSVLFNQLRQEGQIKELSDDYFLNLLAMTDMSKTVSYCKNIKAWLLGLYRVSSLFWFYGWMFLFRPFRILKTLRNVFREKQESRMEMALKNLIMPKKSFSSTHRLIPG